MAGVSKATIHRQIKSGKLSAARRDDNTYSIDPAELHRVHPFRVNGSGEPITKQVATEEGNARNGSREAELAVELGGARALLAALERQLADARDDRDAWRDQAQTAQRLLVDMRPSTPKKGLLGRLFG